MEWKDGQLLAVMGRGRDGTVKIMRKQQVSGTRTTDWIDIRLWVKKVITVDGVDKIGEAATQKGIMFERIPALEAAICIIKDFVPEEVPMETLDRLHDAAAKLRPPR